MKPSISIAFRRTPGGSACQTYAKLVSIYAPLFFHVLRIREKRAQAAKQFKMQPVSFSSLQSNVLICHHNDDYGLGSVRKHSVEVLVVTVVYNNRRLRFEIVSVGEFISVARGITKYWKYLLLSFVNGGDSVLFCTFDDDDGLCFVLLFFTRRRR
jgi:hypothetical protein